MTNFGLELAFNKVGISLVRTPVGASYLQRSMVTDGLIVRVPQSGHLIFLDHNTTGDGLISALQILSLMKRTGRRLSELAACMSAAPQVLLRVDVSDKPDLA